MTPQVRSNPDFLRLYIVVVAIGIFLVLTPPTVLASEQWLRLTSPDFELFTTWGEKEGRAAILHFQQIQDFFLRSTGNKKSVSGKVRIVAFRSEKEYKVYQPNEIAAAFYVGSRDRDYIVMRDIGKESYWTATHEYFHLWVKNERIPIWLNEGLADFYSTLEPQGDKVLVGDFPLGRFQVLQNEKWIDLEMLTAADHKSPLYNEKNRAGVFYAESWALTHMLNISPDYRERFNDFYKAVGTGVATKEAFERIYGKSMPEVRKDLDQYMHGNRFKGALLPLQLERATDKVEVGAASALESGIILADLLATEKDKQGDAKRAYELLARENPNSWEAEAAIAYLSLWNDKDRQEANRHFARAVELGSTSSKLYFDYANILRSESSDDAAVVPLLKKAVELQPDYKEAHYNLAFLLYRQHKYAEAIQHFGSIRQVSREQAGSMFGAMAYSYAQIGQTEDARKSAERAREYAQSPSEILEAERLLKYVTRGSSVEIAVAAKPAAAASDRPENESSGPPKLARKAEQTQATGYTESPDEPDELPRQIAPRSMIEGTLQQVDCLGKSARMRIFSAGKRMSFAILNPSQVLIKKGEGSATIDFTCGPQKPVTVVLVYEPKENKELGTVGDVKSIEFK